MQMGGTPRTVSWYPRCGYQNRRITTLNSLKDSLIHPGGEVHPGVNHSSAVWTELGAAEPGFGHSMQNVGHTAYLCNTLSVYFGHGPITMVSKVSPGCRSQGLGALPRKCTVSSLHFTRSILEFFESSISYPFPPDIMRTRFRASRFSAQGMALTELSESVGW